MILKLFSTRVLIRFSIRIGIKRKSKNIFFFYWRQNSRTRILFFNNYHYSEVSLAQSFYPVEMIYRHEHLRLRSRYLVRESKERDSTALVTGVKRFFFLKARVRSLVGETASR